MTALVKNKNVDMRAIDDPIEHVNYLNNSIPQEIQVELIAHFVEFGYKPDEMGQNKSEHLICDVGVGGIAEPFVEGDQFAHFANVFVVFIGAGLDCHLEHIFEELLEIHVAVQSRPEIFKDVAGLYTLKYTHQVVENISKSIFFRQFFNKFVYSEFVLVKDVIEVERDSYFAYFNHDLGHRVAIHGVAVEEGEELPEDIRFEEGLPFHVPFQFEYHPFHYLQGVEQFGIAVGAQSLLVEVLENYAEVLNNGGLGLVLLVVDLFVEIGAENVDEEQFMFYFEGGGRLEIVEVLYQQLLAEYEDSHVQVAGIG